MRYLLRVNAGYEHLTKKSEPAASWVRLFENSRLCMIFLLVSAF